MLASLENFLKPILYRVCEGIQLREGFGCVREFGFGSGVRVREGVGAREGVRVCEWVRVREGVRVRDGGSAV